MHQPTTCLLCAKIPIHGIDICSRSEYCILCLNCAKLGTGYIDTLPCVSCGTVSNLSKYKRNSEKINIQHICGKISQVPYGKETDILTHHIYNCMECLRKQVESMDTEIKHLTITQKRQENEIEQAYMEIDETLDSLENEQNIITELQHELYATHQRRHSMFSSTRNFIKTCKSLLQNRRSSVPLTRLDINDFD